MHGGLFNTRLSFYPVKGRFKFNLISKTYCLFLSCYFRKQWLGSDAIVAELVDALGSGSSVHWMWEFESPLFNYPFIRKCNSTQTLAITTLTN